MLAYLRPQKLAFMAMLAMFIDDDRLEYNLPAFLMYNLPMEYDILSVFMLDLPMEDAILSVFTSNVLPMKQSIGWVVVLLFCRLLVLRVFF